MPLVPRGPSHPRKGKTLIGGEEQTTEDMRLEEFSTSSAEALPRAEDASTFAVYFAGTGESPFMRDLRDMVAEALAKTGADATLALVHLEGQQQAENAASVEMYSAEGERVAKMRRIPHGYEGMEEAAQELGVDIEKLKYNTLLRYAKQVVAYALCYTTRGESCHLLSDADELADRVVLFHWSVCPHCHSALPRIAAAASAWKARGGRFGVMEVGCDVGKGLWQIVSSAIHHKTVPRLVYFDKEGAPHNVALPDSSVGSDAMLAAMQEARDGASAPALTGGGADEGGLHPAEAFIRRIARRAQ